MLSDDKGNYVYIVNGKNEVERRDIKIGTVNDSGVTIAAGLSGNEAGRALGRAVPQPGPEGESAGVRRRTEAATRRKQLSS